jgi:hypothetical protein
MALERAVVINQRSKLDLTADSSDAICRRTECTGNRPRYEVLNLANHQCLEFPGAIQGCDLWVEHRQAERDHDLGLGVDELVFELPRCRQWTEIDDATACHEHREKEDYEVRCVGQMQSHMQAGPTPSPCRPLAALAASL